MELDHVRVGLASDKAEVIGNPICGGGEGPGTVIDTDIDRIICSRGWIGTNGERKSIGRVGNCLDRLTDCASQERENLGSIEGGCGWQHTQTRRNSGCVRAWDYLKAAEYIAEGSEPGWVCIKACGQHIAGAGLPEWFG